MIGFNSTDVTTGRFVCSSGIHKANVARGNTVLEYSVPYGADEEVLTPQEVRAELARERREATKARQLDRTTKRKHKRSQSY